MKISTLFMALLLGLTALTACQDDAPAEKATPATGETTTQPTAAPQNQAVEVPMPQPATTVPGNNQPQIIPQGQVPPTTVAPPTGAVAAGMNPAHGQPGHRCDIAVGAPLNSKPAPPKPQ